MENNGWMAIKRLAEYNYTDTYREYQNSRAYRDSCHHYDSNNYYD